MCNRRLEDQREQLAPAIAHYQQVQLLAAEVDATRLKLLTDQQDHGSLLLQLQSQQASIANQHWG